MPGSLRQLAIVLFLTAVPSAPPSLSVQVNGEWREWWRRDQAPMSWDSALPLVSRAVTWQDSSDGIALGTLRLSGSGEAWRIRAIIVTVDPARVRFSLEGIGPHRGAPYDWTIRRAGPQALLALNAGQFDGNGPWGWLVRNGREVQPPGRGPLASAVVVGNDGRVAIVNSDRLDSLRATGTVQLAFQSYPTILMGTGQVPAALRPGHDGGVDLEHRDARLAIGRLRNGRLIIVLTRFEGLGGVLENLPFGLTTPEMAALLGALGAERAVLLDGGVSSQLLVRLGGRLHRWTGLRYVPVGLVGEAR